MSHSLCDTHCTSNTVPTAGPLNTKLHDGSVTASLKRLRGLPSEDKDVQGRRLDGGGGVLARHRHLADGPDLYSILRKRYIGERIIGFVLTRFELRRRIAMQARPRA